jgi:hypothetical protein
VSQTVNKQLLSEGQRQSKPVGSRWFQGPDPPSAARPLGWQLKQINAQMNKARGADTEVQAEDLFIPPTSLN